MIDDAKRSNYFGMLKPGATGAPNPVPVPQEVAKQALVRAHALRQFEIDNYWKRATYFWGFQLTAFAGLALSADKGEFKPPIVLIVATLGSVTALASLLTAWGSKMWQENWERHVDLLEVEQEGALMEIVLTDRKCRFSVTRVNERLNLLLMLGWLTAFIAAAAVMICPKLASLPARAASLVQIIIASAMLVGSFAILLLFTRSKLDDRVRSWENL